MKTRHYIPLQTQHFKHSHSNIVNKKNEKGFTLVETLIYMAISTILCTTLIAFSFSLIMSQAQTDQNLEQELVGITLFRLIETRLHNTISYDNLIATSSGISNFALSTSTSLDSISFNINKQAFNLTFVP